MSPGDRMALAAAGWVGWVQRRPRAVTLGYLLVTAALGVLAAKTLTLNSDEKDLFSKDLPFYQLRAEYYRALPSLVDPIVVVIDGETAGLAEDAAARLKHRIESDPEHFAGVHQPGGGRFFEEHGLLYLEPAELDELAEHLFAAQPFLGSLSADFSLVGFADLLGEATAQDDPSAMGLNDVLDRVDAVVQARLENHERNLSWTDVITGRPATTRDRRRTLLVMPVTDYSSAQAGERTLDALGRIVGELGYEHDVRVRVTGVLALANEEMAKVSRQSVWAGAASFVLVALILVSGLGSLRMVLVSLATLVAGLVQTAGFAALTVGRLNLISVTFAVLFIGLSIDFAIHLCIGFSHALREEGSSERALPRAAGRIGGSLVLCAATTAIGFYSFAPTDYTGVAELGIIAGSGMLISLAANLTLLPALLVWAAPVGGWSAPAVRPTRGAALLDLPVRHARAVLLGTAGLVLVALGLAREARFDPNPLHMRDPTTDSVRAFDELLADGDGSVWNMNVLAADASDADALARRLEGLPVVDHARTIDDFVPADQAQELEVLSDVDFWLSPTLATPLQPRAHSVKEQKRALGRLKQELQKLSRGGAASPALAHSAAQLASSLVALEARWRQGGDAARDLALLERSLLGRLPGRLARLQTAIATGPVEASDLPPDLVDLMTARDGRARIEVFPAEDLDEQRALEAYVAGVRSVAPRAFGEALVILESGRTAVRSLRQALATSAVLIVLLLIFLWGSFLDAALVATPLGLAAVFTVAVSVQLDMPFNFANVIVIPLLLGMGVDTGIHLVHRSRAARLPSGSLLRTSTARAVVLSALTTIASFGTLGFTTHRGMASLGRLLTLGLLLILLCNLLVLPALLPLFQRRRAANGEKLPIPPLPTAEPRD